MADVLRELFITVNDLDDVEVYDSDQEGRAITSFAGYEGEHLTTRLVIEVPSDWDTYDVYVSWSAADGWVDESPVLIAVGGNA